MRYRFFRKGNWINIDHRSDTDQRFRVDEYEPLIKEAENKLTTLMVTNPDQDTARYIDPKARYSVTSEFGKNEIYIFGRHDVLPKPKKKVKKEIEIETFVPAIAITANTAIANGYPGHATWQSVSDVFVCSGKDWEGLAGIVKDCYLGIMYETGVRYKDKKVNPDKQLLGCTNWGDRDIWFDYEQNTIVDSDSQGDWSPIQYHGYKYSCSGEDTVIHEFASVSPLYYYGLGCYRSTCGFGDLKDDCDADPEWGCWSCYIWNDGGCLEWDSPAGIPPYPCCVKYKEHTNLLGRYKCCSWIYNTVEAKAYPEERSVVGGCSHVGGFCFCDWVCSSFEVIDVMSGNIGSAQTRTRQIDYVEEMPRYSMDYWGGDPVYRSDGTIVIPNLSLWVFHDTRVAQVPAPCQSQQNDTYNDEGNWYYPYGFEGTYVRDIGPNEAYICKKIGLKNAWLNIGADDVASRVYTTSCSPMRNSPYRTSDGTFIQGNISNCPQPPGSEYFSMRIVMDTNPDEAITLAESTDTSLYFRTTDVQILDYKGKPVYMYAFIGLRDRGGYDCEYVQYGYFLEGEHHYKQFETAGFRTHNGYINVLHKIDEIDGLRQPMYGFGQCAGYIKKTKVTVYDYEE